MMIRLIFCTYIDVRCEVFICTVGQGNEVILFVTPKILFVCVYFNHVVLKVHCMPYVSSRTH